MDPDGAKSIFTGPRILDKFVDMYVPDRLNDGAGASQPSAVVWTLRAHVQKAQQLDLTRTTARDFSAWQLSEEHRLALERQAEEHHRDHGPIAARQAQGLTKKRHTSGEALRMTMSVGQSAHTAGKPGANKLSTDPAHLPCTVCVLALIRFVQGADVDALEDAAPFGDGSVIRDMTMLY